MHRPTPREYERLFDKCSLCVPQHADPGTQASYIETMYYFRNTLGGAQQDVDLLEEYDLLLRGDPAANPSELAAWWSKIVSRLMSLVHLDVEVLPGVFYSIEGAHNYHFRDISPSFEEAFKLVGAAAEKGVPGAKLLHVLIGEKRMTPEATFAALRDCAEDKTLPDAERKIAASHLGQLYAAGQGCERDEALARKWLSIGDDNLRQNAKLLDAVNLGYAKMLEWESLQPKTKYTMLLTDRQLRWVNSLHVDPTGGTGMKAICIQCRSKLGVLRCPCNQEHYCSKACQQRHWEHHKHICTAKKKVLAPTAAAAAENTAPTSTPAPAAAADPQSAHR